MWNIPTKERLGKIAKIYETENIPVNQKQIYLHFFIGGCDWFVAEYDGKTVFWGFAILNDDFANAEWGYISFEELKGIKVGLYEVNCEKEESWVIRPASEVEKISICHMWG